MKKLILLFILLSTFTSAREFKNIYKYELSENDYENEIVGIFYKGNSKHTSLSLEKTLPSLKFGNMKDKNILSDSNLYILSLNPSKNIKIEFEKDKNNQLEAHVIAKEDYLRSLEFEFNSHSTNHIDEEVFPKLKMSYKNYNITGKDTIIEIYSTINPINISKYVDIGASLVSPNYLKNEILTYKFKSSYYKQNDKSSNYSLYSNLNLKKFIFVKGNNNLNINLDTRYIFNYNNKREEYINYVSSPIYLEYRYSTDNFNLQLNPGFELGLLITPNFKFRYNVFLESEIGYNYEKIDIVSKNNFKYEFFENTKIENNDKYFLKVSKKDKKSDIIYVNKNNFNYRFTDNYSIYLFNENRVEANKNFKNQSHNVVFGLGLNANKNDEYDIDFSLGYDIITKKNMQFILNTYFKIK